MQPNIGTVDRSIRAIVGLVLIASWFFDLQQGTLGILSLIIGISLIVTVAVRRCPPYVLLGINTGASGE
ncbi:MAG: DUF2892 domain-containing protein [Gammaproteobacteria bacterium]|nr:MAG: DUF2892 domain-containing protein [Gammaproteobacteria bacterium]UCH39443.1 MAG: DUF2892 domain-containing protein [Gammaproteobacteria bacterium]